MEFNGSPAVPDREKLIRGISGSRQELSGFEVDILAASGDQGAILGCEISEEWMLGQKRSMSFCNVGLPNSADFLGDIDGNGTPGNAAAAADAAGSLKLIDPRREFVSHPLPVAGERRRPHGPP